MPNLRRMQHSTESQQERPAPQGHGVAHIREYVGEMSIELAKMARQGGDEKLACLLEVAADVARRPDTVTA